jgi:hypothetical protein
VAQQNFLLPTEGEADIASDCIFPFAASTEDFSDFGLDHAHESHVEV